MNTKRALHRALLVFGIGLFGISSAENVKINHFPINLPKDQTLSDYSPLLEIEYTGLQQATYTLKMWLLERTMWYCASSKLCEKTMTLDNSKGDNAFGVVRIVENIDVYDYSNMDLVVRLYLNGSQAAWTEQYVNGVTDRAPALAYIPTQTCFIGQTLTFQAVASDPEGNPITFWASGLPDGATFSNHGFFSWKPAAEGVWNVVVSATDGVTYDSQIVTLIVGAKPVFADVAIPRCGTNEDLTGRVEGIGNVNDYKIVCCIFISGSGWWTKPFANQPKTPIQPDGTFTVDITTGGIDPLATIIYLAVCRADASIPVLSGSSQIPDGMPVLFFQKYYRDPADCHRVISFSGHSWYVKNSGAGTLGPGPCRFSDLAENVYVDENGYLHLKIIPAAGGWACSEVVCLDEMGYGVFSFELVSDPSDLDANAVLGLYIWADDAPNGKEIDIEFSRWANPLTDNAQFVVQPWTTSGHLYRFEFPNTNAASLHRFKWQTERVDFQSFVYPEPWPTLNTIVSDWTFNGSTPQPGRVYPRMNLWLVDNLAPTTGNAQEVIVKSFKFQCLQQIEGDINQDCKVNLADFYFMASNWLTGI